MKLFTLLLSIAVLSNGFAQEPPRRGFYKGTLTYLDGKTEEGYIGCPFSPTKQKIEFIPLKGEDVTKVKSDELKSLTFTTILENSSYRFDHLLTAFNKKPIGNKKYWLYLDSEISCPALSCYIIGDNFEIDRQGIVTIVSGETSPDVSIVRPITFYLKKPNEENANMVGGRPGKMNNKTWKSVFQEAPEILKWIEEGKYDITGKEKIKRTMKGESRTSIVGDAVEAIVKDYCELHKEK